jgi:hypothetical protein
MRALVVVALSVALAGFGAGCGEDTPAARSASQARPMDEPRAQGVIARTFQAEGVDPEPGRTFAVSAIKPHKLIVAAAGHKYGVIWLTRDDVRELAAFLPKHENDDGALVVLDGAGPDSGAHALALYETDYMTDDLAGESHSATEIAAERRLERDVRDFLLKAKNEQWP